MKLSPAELSAQKSFWLLFRAEKQLSGEKDGSKVLLVLATQSRKGRPYLHTQALIMESSRCVFPAGEQTGISKRYPKPEGLATLAQSQTWVGNDVGTEFSPPRSVP